MTEADKTAKADSTDKQPKERAEIEQFSKPEPETPEEIVEAQQDYLKLQKASGDLETKEIEHRKLGEALDRKRALYIGKLSAIYHTVGDDVARQAQFLDGIEIEISKGIKQKLQVTGKSSFEGTLIRGTQGWIERELGDTGKQLILVYANNMRLSRIEMPGKTAKEIAAWVSGPHMQENGKEKKGLAAASKRYQWQKKLKEQATKAMLIGLGRDDTDDTAPNPNDDAKDSPHDETGDVTDDGLDDDSFAGTEEEILETHIEAVKDCASPLEGQQASDLTMTKRFALIPVVIEADNIYLGFEYADEDVTAFNKFMNAAETRNG